MPYKIVSGKGSGRRYVRPRLLLRHGTTVQGARAAYKRTSLYRNRFGQGAVHCFKRILEETIDIKDGVTETDRAYQLSSVPSYAEFTTLFDQYRIVKIKERIMFNKNSAEMGAISTTTDVIPICTSVIDYDDATALSTENAFLQYENVKINRLDKPFTRSFEPRIATAAYGGTLFTSYMNTKAPWLDTNSPNVPHYGFKMWTDASTNGGAGTIRVGVLKLYTTIWFECKNTR